MYKQILVAVDGSAISDHALGQAIALARQVSATLRLAHVVDMGVLPLAPELAINVEDYTQARRRAGEKILAAALDKASAVGLNAETMLLETGTPVQHVATVIVAEAARWRADLVVLGAHGHRGPVHLLLGSVADGVVRRAVVPVLLIPSPVPAKG